MSIQLKGNDDSVFTSDVLAPNIPTQGQIVGHQQGLWTPVAFGGTTTTYTNQIGNWSRSGQTVYAQVDYMVSGLGNGSTSTIAGLPYIASQNCAGSLGYFENLATNVVMLLIRTDGGQSYIATGGLAQAEKVGPSVINNIGNNTRIMASITYITDDTTWTPINGATVS